MKNGTQKMENREIENGLNIKYISVKLIFVIFNYKNFKNLINFQLKFSQ
jgi:hypothetical protein